MKRVGEKRRRLVACAFLVWISWGDTMRNFGLVLMCCGLATSSLLAQSAATRMMAQKGWLADLEKGRAESRRSGKPLMVAIRCDP